MDAPAPGRARPGPATVVARTLLVTLGLALIANASWLFATVNRNLGMVAVAASGVVLLAWGLAFGWVGRRRPLAALASVCVATVVVGSGLLAAYGNHDTVSYDEDAVIVLGAAVHGSELSPTLQRRLDAALDYHARNPRALLLVTGGQGAGEDVPEAHAMRAYLTAHGVGDADLVVEDRATSTEQNLSYSKPLLDARLPPGYRVALITSDFHVYRAERLARASGLEPTHAHAETPWYFWPTNYLRESLAVAASWLGV